MHAERELADVASICFSVFTCNNIPAPATAAIVTYVTRVVKICFVLSDCTIVDNLSTVAAKISQPEQNLQVCCIYWCSLQLAVFFWKSKYFCEIKVGSQSEELNPTTTIMISRTAIAKRNIAQLEDLNCGDLESIVLSYIHVSVHFYSNHTIKVM